MTDALCNINVIPFTAQTIGAFLLVNFSFRNQLQFNIILDTGLHNQKLRDFALKSFQEVYRNPKNFQLPRFEGIDCIFISHYHQDHCNLLQDIVQIISQNERRNPKDILVLLSNGTNQAINEQLGQVRRVTRNYEFDIPHDFLKIRAEFISSGHVNGSVMIYLNVNGVTLLYTGDFNPQKERDFLVPLDMTTLQHKYRDKIHLLITEATNCSTNKSQQRDTKEIFKNICSLLGKTCLISEKICLISAAWDCIEEALDLGYAIRNFSQVIDQEMGISVRRIPIYILNTRSTNFERDQYAPLAEEVLDLVTENVPGGKSPYLVGTKPIFTPIYDQELHKVTEGTALILPNPFFWSPRVNLQIEKWVKDPANALIFFGWQMPTRRYFQARHWENITEFNLTHHADANGVRQLIGALKPQHLFITHFVGKLTEDFYQFIRNTFKGRLNQRFYKIGTQIGQNYQFRIYKHSSQLSTYPIPIQCYQKLREKAAITQIDWQIYLERLLNDLK